MLRRNYTIKYWKDKYKTKRIRRRSRTTLINKGIKNAKLRIYNELKRMASNKEEWKEHGRML
jgi:hypothetical protein